MAVLIAIWGTAFPLVKDLERQLDPFQLTWYRYVPFLVLATAWLLLFRRGQMKRVGARDWAWLAGLGLVGVLGYHIPFNWGLYGAGSVSAATGAILVATTPLWTLLIAVATRRERFHGPTAAGSLLSFIGVVLVVALGQGSPDLRLALKGAVVLVAPLSWAIYSVYGKPLMARHGAPFVTAASLSLGAVALLPLGLTYGVAPLASLGRAAWLELAFLAILSTALGYALYNFALARRSATAVASWIYLNPVVATIMASWVLPIVSSRFESQPVTPWFLVGSALVLGGIVIVNRFRSTTISPGPAAPSAAKP
jgi:drug/metabolite transporter (DMT)-like permease